MKVKKYLISIQGPGEKRYEQFFSQDGFDEIEFIKPLAKVKTTSI